MIQFICIATSILLGLVIAWYVKPPASPIAWHDQATINVAIVTLSSIFLGFYLFNKTIKPATLTESVKKKLTYYKRGYIIRTFLISAVAFFPSALVLFENCYWYFLFPGLALLMLLLTWPTQEKIKDALRVTV
jgi:hypothetical protein